MNDQPDTVAVETPDVGATTDQVTEDSVTEVVEDSGSEQPEAGEATPTAEGNAELTPEQIKEWQQAFENKSAWQRENTRKAQENAAERKQLQELQYKQKQEASLAQERAAIDGNYNLTDEEKQVQKAFAETRAERDLLKQKAQQYENEKVIGQLEGEIDDAVSTALEDGKIDAKYKDVIKKVVRSEYYIDAQQNGNFETFDPLDSAKKAAANFNFNAQAKDYIEKKKADGALKIQKGGGTPPPAAGKKKTDDDIAGSWWKKSQG